MYRQKLVIFFPLILQKELIKNISFFKYREKTQVKDLSTHLKIIYTLQIILHK